MNHIRHKPFPLVVQLADLHRRHPEGHGGVHRNRLYWNQRIRPHALAHSYACRVEYSLEEIYPKIFCDEPQLSALAEDRELPHVYSSTEPVQLCLFMHRRECWHTNMWLGAVVVPLAYHWLANFEEWLFTGVWRGEGTHEIAVTPPKAAPIFPGDQSGMLATVALVPCPAPEISPTTVHPPIHA